mmetsp:Transcript_167741/g.538687  ORF Transcript_167741/g.538687 Transcript_167741/m.538687 type:complete len:450 (+) Transcript_167741:2-1351(+)
MGLSTFGHSFAQPGQNLWLEKSFVPQLHSAMGLSTLVSRLMGFSLLYPWPPVRLARALWGGPRSRHAALPAGPACCAPGTFANILWWSLPPKWPPADHRVQSLHHHQSPRSSKWEGSPHSTGGASGAGCGCCRGGGGPVGPEPAPSAPKPPSGVGGGGGGNDDDTGGGGRGVGVGVGIGGSTVGGRAAAGHSQRDCEGWPMDFHISTRLRCLVLLRCGSVAPMLQSKHAQSPPSFTSTHHTSGGLRCVRASWYKAFFSCFADFKCSSDAHFSHSQHQRYPSFNSVQRFRSSSSAGSSGTAAANDGPPTWEPAAEAAPFVAGCSGIGGGAKVSQQRLPSAAPAPATAPPALHGAGSPAEAAAEQLAELRPASAQLSPEAPVSPLSSTPQAAPATTAWAPLASSLGPGCSCCHDSLCSGGARKNLLILRPVRRCVVRPLSGPRGGAKRGSA